MEQSAVAFQSGPARKLADSAGCGWRHMVAGLYREEPVTDTFRTQAVPEALVVVVTSGTYRIESAKGGRWTSAHYHPGAVGLTAPGNSSVLRWQATSSLPLESVQIRLSAALVEDIRQTLPASSPAFPDVLQLDDPYAAAAGKAIATALHQRAPALYADSLAHALTAHLVLAGSHARQPPTSPGLGHEALRQVTDYIMDNLSGDFTVGDLAAVAHLSPFHFLRMFRQSTGTTPHRYVVGVRMRHAARMLRHTGHPVAQVAVACGYQSPGQFAASFRRHYGTSPTSFRAGGLLPRRGADVDGERGVLVTIPFNT
jgi:AraC family transcriptional regulator